MKRVAILGSTGSIGVQTLDVIRQFPDRLQVVALVANKNADSLLSQATAHNVPHVALHDESAAEMQGLPGGMSAVIDAATAEDVDIVVVCVAGVIGLLPTVAAIRAKKHIALASKEVLVSAGELIMPLVREVGVTMTPIDSEHSAVFQCIQGYERADIDRLYLTASGGPFRGMRASELSNVSVAEALRHPTWSMGGKITVDSATLMNKGLETIEAKWLFGIEIDKVEAVIHPQSIVHSFVRFRDGSVLGQLGWPNMRLPIQYALLYPERVANSLPLWSPVDSPSLTFEPVDTETFRCLRLARDSARVGGTMPCAMNAANEEAANSFLRGECGFLQIATVVEETMCQHQPIAASLENVLEVDAWARIRAREIMEARRTTN